MAQNSARARAHRHWRSVRGLRAGRSAGAALVDEEHEPSYKQEEAPRYHARDVAVVRGRMENAVVVLGSATPSMESFYNARSGKSRLLAMPRRVDDRTMPVVRVIDMRQETRKQKGTPIFSIRLKEAITQRLERHEQTILFLNRRGYSTSLQCPQCGYVAQSLTAVCRSPTIAGNRDSFATSADIRGRCLRSARIVLPQPGYPICRPGH